MKILITGALGNVGYELVKKFSRNNKVLAIYRNKTNMATTVISQPEKEKLYSQVFNLLGMPVRGIELTEEQMDTFMEFSLSEYEQYVSDWLIESQWSALAGLDVDTQSLTRAFTTRSLDYETQYTYSYSKIVGLQANGPHELKKDFFEIEKELVEKLVLSLNIKLLISRKIH